MEFNDNQKRVIEYGQGPLLVEAGPGSGKTTVIVERIKHLINEGVPPETFLVITFTRKAAENLKTKLKQSIPKSDVSKMQISTIHSFCLEYLKTKDIFLNLLDDDTSEKKALFIQKFKNKLGFKDENTLLDYQISSAINKFGEYTSFNVDSDNLISYLEDTKPVSNDYINFINSLAFFSKKRIDDADFKDDWYNARYIQIAKSYPIYLKLLDQEGYVDYDTLQLKTLNELKKDSKTPYTTIFVDEFQDTDPLQFRIFKILQQNSKYFTAVGDVDQHIYAFRSSFADYFDEMSKITDPEIISLDTNYRSTENIVSLTDEFIKHQRGEYSQKHLKSNNSDYNNPNYIIVNENHESEASNIYQTIRYLKDSNKISKYSDVAVLYRNHSNKTVANLIDLFEENNIDFSIRGQADLSDQNEVKSIITLLWYITRKTVAGHIPTNDELDELNLKAFCGEYFEPTFWSLEDETKTYLNFLQDSFYENILEVENEFRKSQGKRLVRSYKNVKKNEDAGTLTEIFKKVKTPTIDLDKITNEKDKAFFEKLNDLREEIRLEEPPTILKIYYDLLAMSDYFRDLKKYNIEAKNLAQLTGTIHNYESFISNTDVRGLFYFLNTSIKNYGSAHDESSVFS